MGWDDVFDDLGERIASRAQLLARGATGRVLTDAVRSGELLRARRDHYGLPTEKPGLISAVRVGGLLDCVSALADAGVFAVESAVTHVRVDHEMSRLRSTRSRFIRLDERNRDDVELHWWPVDRPERAANYSVGIEDALASSLRCQPPWWALASLDNALHIRALSRFAVDRLFDGAPDRVRHLQGLIDARAESGQETVLRMIAVGAGLECDLQVVVPEVGRVDMIVEGCLVLEADSRLAHEGWEHHLQDRRRDLQLARQGFMSLRPAYQHTMNEPVLVRAAVLALLDQSRNFRRSFS
jgi:hypothetical protein